MRAVSKSSFAATYGRRLACVLPAAPSTEIVVPLSPLVLTVLRTAQAAAAIETEEFIARAIVREADFIGLPGLADAREIAKASQAPDRDGPAASPARSAGPLVLDKLNAEAFALAGDLVAVPEFRRRPINRFEGET